MTSEMVKNKARDLGFALCGVAEARPTDHRQHALDWLAAGKHGSMNWMAEHIELRLDPRELLPGARSVICVADHIGPGSEIENHKSEIGNPPGRIARYAQVDDYHTVMKKRLHKLADAVREHHPDQSFRVCVDTAPILEREHAQRAGLGWVGKNTLLIHPRRGSHILLGEIVTTLPLAPDAPEPDHCGTCTRCIEACPTQCITPYEVDGSRCISYLTIENREAIAPQFHPALGDRLYGCDVCQEVCPYNNPDRGETNEAPHESYGEGRAAALNPLQVLNWNEEDRRAAFTRSAMKRAKLHQMKRNALIVLANTAPHDPAARQRLRQVAEDENEAVLVRETANQIVEPNHAK